jgi:hypothetical protein
LAIHPNTQFNVTPKPNKSKNPFDFRNKIQLITNWLVLAGKGCTFRPSADIHHTILQTINLRNRIMLRWTAIAVYGMYIIYM